MATNNEIRIARRAYDRARARELRLVDAIGPRSTQKQIDRAWAAADETNRTRRAWRALVGADD